jgi:hypothetical protein
LAEGVEHDREISELLEQADVGDVGDPQLIEAAELVGVLGARCSG